METNLPEVATLLESLNSRNQLEEALKSSVSSAEQFIHFGMMYLCVCADVNMRVCMCMSG